MQGEEPIEPYMPHVIRERSLGN